MSSDIVIGIDLGTTNSVVAVFENGKARVLPDADGELLRPSAVAVDPKNGGLLVGRAAKDLLALQSGQAAAFFKRGMGQNRSYRLGAQSFDAVELSSLVLRQLADEARAALGEDVRRAVVTVPAYFDEEQRAATMRAGELAGLQVERILNEPTAAAMAYGLHNADSEIQFLVFDLGGGTLDVCVMELFEGILQVKSTAGENFLGGEDFSRVLAEAALAELGLKLDLVFEAEGPEVATILRRAEILKRKLSTEEEGVLVIPPLAGQNDGAVEIVIDQAFAARAWKPLLERLLAPMRQALRDAELRAADLDAVILVGGATRMPIVRRLVADFCGREPLEALDPDLAIAQGAAVQAALVMRDAAVEDIVVTDVLSHSIGVNVSRTVGGRHVGGYYSPILHRNTTIPTSRSEFYYTLVANQRSVTFGVYEGEARRIEDNRHIGELIVSGIPKGDAGKEIEVYLTIDLNGLLEIEAIITETGKKLSKVFERGNKSLEGKELERAMKRLAALKADPRERPENRALTLRAELLWREMKPDERHELAAAIDAFESALLSRERDRVQEARSELRRICEEIEGGERW